MRYRPSPLWSDRRVKPAYGCAEVDWAHPLAQNLVNAWLFNEGAGTTQYSLTQRHKATIGWAGNVPAWNPFGLGNTTTGCSMPQVAASSDARLYPNAFTVLMEFQNFSVPETYGVLCAWGIKPKVHIRASDGAPLLLMGDNNYRYFAAPSGGVAWWLGRKVIAVAVPGAADTSILTASLWVNGTAYPVGAWDNTSGAQTAKSSVFSLGSENYWGAAGGTLVSAALFDRALNDGECRLLTANPYSYLKPVIRRTSITLGGTYKIQNVTKGAGAAKPRLHSPLWPDKQQKPRSHEVEIDWTRPITNGLRAYYPGDRMAEMANEAGTWSIQTVGARIVPAAWPRGGNAFTAIGESADVMWHTATAFNPQNLLKFTVSMWLCTKAEVGCTAQAGWGSAGETNLVTLLRKTWGNVARGALEYGYVTAGIDGVKAINDGVPHLITYQRDSANHQLYVDGKLDAGPTAHGFGATVGLVTKSFWLAPRNTGAMVVDVMGWDRLLSADEIRGLYIDPYCFLKPRVRRARVFLTQTKPAGTASRLNVGTPIWPDLRQKPPAEEVEIDWSDPITRGLVAAYLGLRNLVKPQTAQLAGGLVIQGDDLFSPSASAGRVATFPNIPALNTPAELSVSVYWRPDGTYAYDGGIVAQSSGYIMGWALQRERFISRTFQGIPVLAYTAAPTGRWSHDVLTIKSGTGNPIVVYRNGSPIANASYPDDTTINVYGTPVVALLNSDLGDTGMFQGACGGTLRHAYLWNRALSASEVRQLAADPYCFLRPKVRRHRINTITWAAQSQTYECALTLAAGAGLTPAATATFGAGFTLAAGVGIAHGSQGAMLSNLALSLASSLTTEAGKAMDSAFTLGLSAAILSATQRTTQSAVTLSGAAAITPSAQRTAQSSTTLTAAASLSPEAQAQLAAALTLAVQASQGQNTQVSVAAGLALGIVASINAGTTVNLQSALSLLASAGVVPTASRTAMADLALSLSTALTQSTQAQFGATLILPASVQTTITAQAQFQAAVTLSALAQLSSEWGGAIQLALTLALSASVSGQSQLMASAATTLAAAVALSHTAQLSASPTLSLTASAQLAVQWKQAIEAALTLTAGAGLVGAARADLVAGVPLTAAASITGTAQRSAVAALTLQAAAAMTPTVVATLVSSVTLAGVTALTPGAQLVAQCAAALTGAADLGAVAGKLHVGGVTLDATASLSTDAQHQMAATLALQIQAAISAASQQLAQASVLLSGAARVTPAAQATMTNALTLSVVATLLQAAALSGMNIPLLIKAVAQTLTQAMASNESFTRAAMASNESFTQARVTDENLD